MNLGRGEKKLHRNWYMENYYNFFFFFLTLYFFRVCNVSYTMCINAASSAQPLPRQIIKVHLRAQRVDAHQ